MYGVLETPVNYVGNNRDLCVRLKCLKESIIYSIHLKGKVSHLSNLARLLWDPADISKLRVSSGQDYLICNSNLKNQMDIQTTVAAKKCFEYHNSRLL